MTPCIPPERMAAIAASVPASVSHETAKPAPFALFSLADLRNAATDNAQQPISANALIAAARIAAHENGEHSYPLFAAELQIIVIGLAVELNRLRGHCAIPRSGCQITTAILGDSEAMIEYSHDEDFGPLAERALINGRWIDADQFAEAVIEQWHEAIRADIEQQRKDDAETHAVRRYDAARGL